MHDIVGVSITVATILAATFFSNQSVSALRSELRSEIGSLRSQMLSKLESIQKTCASSTPSKLATTYALPTSNSNTRTKYKAFR